MSENLDVQKTNNGMATAALVLGIVSIVFSFFWFIGLICGILGVVLGIISKNKIKTDPNMGGSGAATAGLITGIIGIIISVIVIIIGILFVGAIVEAGDEGFEEVLRELEKYEELN
ncbi:hypothetical protein CW751_12115 [Brumimicrobium salinarum]|uniref:DUF4190 domain-containing protein n=1 Tax=Brumimicrobium salinarum TaxID=2058658 RepID=A0A2I0R075_9FLAO|nr:DUF4190 domain-containing protein [Brumimicrobium salinarum]PKR79967.1 hypothetical protein CW751_12115 [Brumimicrobium salinarum]